MLHFRLIWILLVSIIRSTIRIFCILILVSYKICCDMRNICIWLHVLMLVFSILCTLSDLYGFNVSWITALYFFFQFITLKILLPNLPPPPTHIVSFFGIINSIFFLNWSRLTRIPAIWKITWGFKLKKLGSLVLCEEKIVPVSSLRLPQI